MGKLDLRSELLLHKYAYYVHANPFISDREYDMLEKKYKELNYPDAEEIPIDDIPIEVTENNCPWHVKMEYIKRTTITEDY